MLRLQDDPLLFILRLQKKNVVLDSEKYGNASLKVVLHNELDLHTTPHFFLDEESQDASIHLNAVLSLVHMKLLSSICKCFRMCNCIALPLLHLCDYWTRDFRPNAFFVP